MKLRLHVLIILLFTFFTFFTSLSQVHTINTAGMTFSPDSLTINVGDTVEFVLDTSHNAVEVDSTTWWINGILPLPGGFNLPAGGGTFIPITAGTHWYVCSPHAFMGMKGVIIVNQPGCMDSTALNYNSLSTIDDSSCIYCSQNGLVFNVGGGAADNEISWGLVELGNSWASASGSSGVSYACVQDNCYVFRMYDSGGDGWNGATYTIMDSVGNVLASGTLLSGTNGSDTLQIGSSVLCPIYGCTNSLACNYDSLATVDDGTCDTIYGCMDTLSINYNPLATCNDGSCLPPSENLFFSEYGEGSSDNKYFEVYNSTSDTIDLTNYAFARVSNTPGNGAGVYEYWNDFDSGAVILPFDVYIVADQDADSIILNEVDQTFGSLSNGDDGFALVYGNNPGTPMSPSAGGYQILDWIGDWNGDPGSGWEVAGTNSATRNHTLVRKCSISQGDTSWANAAGTDPVNSQWIVLPEDDWSDIGQHIITPCNLLYGCTDSAACNYDSLANLDDGSCTYSGQVYQNNVTICNGQTYSINGNTYDSTGMYIDSISSSLCDSVVYTNLTIYSQIGLHDTVSGGILDTTFGGGNFYSGSQYLELSCYMPSELVSAVVYSEDTTLTTFEIRDNNGTVLYNTTVNVIPGGHRIYFNYSMSAGLDYEVGVNGNSNALYRNNSGVNYPYNFSSLAAVTSSSAGGNYYYFFYDIEVKRSTTNYSICDGESITVGSSVYNTSGLYTDSLISSIGCDSLVFTNLVLHPNASLTNPQTICAGETYSVGSNIYDSSGTYIDSLNTQYGCDSIVTTILIVDSIVGGSSSNNQSICLGDSVSVGNSTYFTDGVYSDTLSSINGCDSIVTTSVTVFTITGTNPQTICLGDSISVGNSVYYNAGVYNDTLQSMSGCDSIITTTLVTNSASYGSFGGILDTVSGPGAFSSYNGQLNFDNISTSILTSATVYAEDTNSVTFELRDDNGIVLQNITHMVYPGLQRLNFNFLMPVDSNLHLGISAGGSGLYRSNIADGGTWSYPFSIGPVTINSANTGSTDYYYFYYDLEIMTYSSYIDTAICDGDSIQIGFNTYNTAGVYLDTFMSSNLCDSVVYMNLDYNQSPISDTTIYICEGDSIIISGNVYNTPVVIIDTFAANLCDSIHSTYLDYYQTPSLFIQSVPDPAEICLGDSVILEGSDGFVDYSWTDVNSYTILINHRLVDYPTIDTWYMLSAIDSNGCVSVEDIWVYVDSCLSWNCAPNSLSCVDPGDGTGIYSTLSACESSCVTSINESDIQNIQIYPNPSTGLFTIEFRSIIEKNSNISILNYIGDVVFFEELMIGEFSKNIDLSEFSKGIYLIELKTELGFYKKKIILQ